ncbi:MAG: hypothetical protein HOP36_12740 [Methyloglobulus sp.]|nr:hypothetical protein [Methyloglobulus sp.]
MPYAPDFRWMLGMDDTPWYPAAKLFRQTEIGDWDGVINKIENALKLYPYTQYCWCRQHTPENLIGLY